MHKSADGAATEDKDQETDQAWLGPIVPHCPLWVESGRSTYYPIGAKYLALAQTQLDPMSYGSARICLTLRARGGSSRSFRSPRCYSADFRSAKAAEPGDPWGTRQVGSGGALHE